MRRSIFVTLMICLGAVTSVHATVVIDFTLADLIRFSQVCARVRALESAEKAGWSTYRLEIVDSVYGPAQEIRELPLLQGVVGMPRLEPGHEYLIFVNLDNRIERIIGFQWGTYEIVEERLVSYGGRPITWQTTGGAKVAGLDGRLVEVDQTKTAPAEPVSFEELRERIIALRGELVRTGELAARSD